MGRKARRNEADEFIPAHFDFAHRLIVKLGAEAHDGVVITDGGGGEDEVEVGLVDVRRAELGLGVPGGCPAGIVIGEDGL